MFVAACASAPTTEPDSRNDTAQALFELTSRRVHDYLLTVDAQTVEALIDAENRLSKAQRANLIAIAKRGIALAQAAVARDPTVAQHHLLLAWHLSIGALGQSRFKSVLQGRGHRIPNSCDESIRLDRTFAAAGALRLKGKFLISAPWPFGDTAAGETALREALAIRPVPEAHLHLGDALWGRGKRAAARAEWERALTAPSSENTRIADAQVRELARRRLRYARE